MTSGPPVASTTARARADVLADAPSPRWLAGAATLALTGATLGTALDAIHVHTDTTAYAEPVLYGQAWWVPPLFASAGVLIGLARPIAERLVGRPGAAPTWPAVLAGMLLFISAYALSGLLDAWPWACAALLTGLFVVGWRQLDGSGLGLVLAVLTALGGTLVEAALVSAGAFAYVSPSMGGVSVWLPALYCCAALGVGALGKRLVDGRAS
jgi:hypothetical protein